MSVSKLSRPFPWFRLGLAAVFLVSVCLRFWGLSRFNTLVFDEVYYAKFANDYLTNTQFFNAHPPLSQYIIAIGIWIGTHLPFGQDTANMLTGSLRSTWSYRWLNALTGSLIPLVVAGIAYQISHRRSYALIAAILFAADGLFLVESRYALNNVYLVIFGLLGQWFLLIGLERDRKRKLWLTLAGISFGASAAIKWNGLWFLLGVYLIWITAWVLRWMKSRQGDKATRGELLLPTSDLRTGGFTNHFDLTTDNLDKPAPATSDLPITNYQLPATNHQLTSPLENLTQLNWLSILFYLGIVPVLVYSISWIPHLQLNPTPGFFAIQKEILDYHERIGSGPKVHPYCAAWYTWPLMLRPIAYFYKTAQSLTEPVLIVGPPLPTNSVNVIYDVHAMGNPLLWWFSTVAIIFLLWILVKAAIRSYKLRPRSDESPSLLTPHSSLLPTNTWIALYSVINWLANLLPWVKVTRCTFIYHYMGASVFAGLGLAWIVDQWLRSYRRSYRILGVTAIFLILLAFVFWMPVYLGLPLSRIGFRLRMWLPTWI